MLNWWCRSTSGTFSWYIRYSRERILCRKGWWWPLCVERQQVRLLCPWLQYHTSRVSAHCHTWSEQDKSTNQHYISPCIWIKWIRVMIYYKRLILGNEKNANILIETPYKVKRCDIIILKSSSAKIPLYLIFLIFSFSFFSSYWEEKHTSILAGDHLYEGHVILSVSYIWKQVRRHCFSRNRSEISKPNYSIKINLLEWKKLL